MGMTGLETALSVVALAMFEGDHEFTWSDVARTMSQRPAAIGQVHDQGRPLTAGEPANLTLVDPAATWTVQPEQMSSTSQNTPFGGRRLPGRIHTTFYRGVPTVLDGRLHHHREDQPSCASCHRPPPTPTRTTPRCWCWRTGPCCAAAPTAHVARPTVRSSSPPG